MSTIDADADAGRGGFQTAAASLNEEKGKTWSMEVEACIMRGDCTSLSVRIEMHIVKGCYRRSFQPPCINLHLSHTHLITDII
jgi:hypothetical protein